MYVYIRRYTRLGMVSVKLTKLCIFNASIQGEI